MSDIDSYLLKCALESIEQNISTQDIQERCECQMGFQQSHSECTPEILPNIVPPTI